MYSAGVSLRVMSQLGRFSRIKIHIQSQYLLYIQFQRFITRNVAGIHHNTLITYTIIRLHIWFVYCESGTLLTLHRRTGGGMGWYVAFHTRHNLMVPPVRRHCHRKIRRWHYNDRLFRSILNQNYSANVCLSIACDHC